MIEVKKGGVTVENWEVAGTEGMIVFRGEEEGKGEGEGEGGGG